MASEFKDLYDSNRITANLYENYYESEHNASILFTIGALVCLGVSITLIIKNNRVSQENSTVICNEADNLINNEEDKDLDSNDDVDLKQLLQSEMINEDDLIIEEVQNEKEQEILDI